MSQVSVSEVTVSPTSLGIGTSGNMISRLGPPEQYNDALWLSSANQFYLRRDGLNWMQSDLSLGSHKVTGMSKPEADQDGVNLGTFRASEARLLEQANHRY